MAEDVRDKKRETAKFRELESIKKKVDREIDMHGYVGLTPAVEKELFDTDTGHGERPQAGTLGKLAAEIADQLGIVGHLRNW